MADFVYINKINEAFLTKNDIEIVERKGIGHPDTICDAIVDEVSRQLSLYYMENFGQILHHNVDKATLAAGASEATFGGGRVLEPIYLLIVGRAATLVKTENGFKRVPIGSIVMNAANRYIEENFRYLDPKKHVVVDYKIRPGSADLVGLFSKHNSIPLANDTSVGVSFAPLSPTENLVYQTERLLNSRELKKDVPELGEDIKVMGLRRDNKIRLTIAAAMISSLVPDLSHYLSVKETVTERVEKLADKLAPDYEVEVFVNTADIIDEKNPLVYLTVTGTSAEAGDDGQVGRGNRVNGLITPYRPMTLEAAAGKNPVNHVGKIYSVLARQIANAIVKEIPEIKTVYVEILSQIGKPINKPQIANVAVNIDESVNWNTIKSTVQAITEEKIANVTKITEAFLKGEIIVY